MMRLPVSLAGDAKATENFCSLVFRSVGNAVTGNRYWKFAHGLVAVPGGLSVGPTLLPVAGE